MTWRSLGYGSDAFHHIWWLYGHAPYSMVSGIPPTDPAWRYGTCFVIPI